MVTKARSSVTALRVRLAGRKDEIDAAVEKLRGLFDVASVSKPVPSRLTEGEFLVYVRVRNLASWPKG